MLYTGLSETRNKPRLPVVAGRFVRRLVPVIYILTGVAFVADLMQDNVLAYGIIYTPLIATALFHQHRRGLWLLTLCTCIMVLLGVFIPVVNLDLATSITNRVLSIL